MHYNNSQNDIFLAGQQMPPPPTGCRSCGGESTPIPPTEPSMRQRSTTSFYRAGRPTGVMDNNLSMQLGMAYVPWQQWNQTNSIDQALNRGTLFPELDFPFVMGRCR